MADVTHRQYDELPVRDFTLGFDGIAPASWPPLATTDKVTMVVANGTGSATTVALAKVDLVARIVRWTPASPLNATAGTFPFVIRVTAGTNSYTHPATGSWNLIIEPAVVAADVADPA